MVFATTIANPIAKQNLQQAFAKNRLGHALLLEGKEGSGNLAAALAICQLVNCENPTAEPDACGECNSCLKIQKCIHPDIHFCFPVAATSESGTAASSSTTQFLPLVRKFLLEHIEAPLEKWVEYAEFSKGSVSIKVNEIETMLKDLRMQSYEANYKCFIVWHPEKMNIQSSNKILKSLEEPADNTLFLLVTDSTQTILPTILSRVQRVYFPPIPAEIISQELSKKIENIEAESIAHQCNGNMYLAKKLAAHENISMYFPELVNWLRMCYALKVMNLVEWTEQMSKQSRDYQKLFLQNVLDFLEKMMRKQYGIAVSFTPEQEEFASKFSPFFNTKNASLIYTKLNEAIGYIDGNANAKILLMDTSLQLHLLLRMQ